MYNHIYLCDYTYICYLYIYLCYLYIYTYIFMSMSAYLYLSIYLYLLGHTYQIRLLPSIYRILNGVNQSFTVIISVCFFWIPFISICFKRELEFTWEQMPVIKLNSKFGVLWSSNINTRFILQWCLLEHQYAGKHYKWWNSIFPCSMAKSQIYWPCFCHIRHLCQNTKSIKDICRIHRVIWTLLKFAHR